MDELDLGWRFWAKLAGLFVVGAIVMLIILLLVGRAAYEWGIFGVFLVMAGVALLAGWIYDRREARRKRSYSQS